MFKCSHETFCRVCCLPKDKRCLWGRTSEPQPKEQEATNEREEKAHVLHKDVLAVSKHFDKRDKDKESFLTLIHQFTEETTRKRQPHVEFIYGAMRCMKEFGVHRDLQTYKALMDIFPKGRMRTHNYFQELAVMYPKQQECAITLLDEMEYNGVIPDREMEKLVISIFGKRTRVWRKVARQIYWFSKLKNASPFPLPETLPNDAFELAKIAITRMSLDLQAEITAFSTDKIEDCIDKTWIISSQSPSQKEILNNLKERAAVYVYGPFTVWLKYKSISYFVLRASPSSSEEKFVHENDDDPLDVYDLRLNVYGGKSAKEVLSHQKKIHEQPEGNILAICATGTSSRDSVLSWIRILETFNHNLSRLQVVFTSKGSVTDVATMNNLQNNNFSEN
ncbi:evolutionarily conserved signaling intermediate in Toll pathway-like isoform X2 [Leptotrombidium deliense]|uniref:Evolutionarily conserved signaling intermediate in Toll pathway, mitochondrial n=1 Tax=Leptotrombidium deliense TaxID=299467 RepID=A0A443SSM5_9ACAR|nr:evolutionarily conserved signaling intermediate in Toll pathway-like isoform X2 [Leptotrombidium deliense]